MGSVAGWMEYKAHHYSTSFRSLTGEIDGFDRQNALCNSSGQSIIYVVKVRPPTMSHFASPLGLLLILALSTTSPMEARPAKHSHQDDHMQGLIPNPRLGQGHHQHRHAIPYVQINDDGQVSKSEHQNEYTLMDIQFTNTGIVIKGRKSARYLCSHTNSTLYSMPQLEENCTFKESTTSNQRRDDGHLEQRSSSQAKTGSACVQSEQINPNSPDPVEMIV